MSLDGVSQKDPKGGAGWEEDVRGWPKDGAKANKRGNVIRMNPALMQWAYGLTKGMVLPEDAPMKALRMKFKGMAGTVRGPQVQVGANMATEIFWHGGEDGRLGSPVGDV